MSDIRVLLVDDHGLIRRGVRSMLSEQDDIVVVGEAHDGSEAVQRTEGSSTVAALDRGVHFIGKKVVEEAAESWMAAEHEGPERAAEEISQLLYQAQVLMIATGLELKDVYRHL